MVSVLKKHCSVHVLLYKPTWDIILSPIWAYMIKNTRKRKDKKQCLLLSQELENCNTKYFDIIVIIVSKNSMSRQFLSNFCFSTQIWIELWILERLRWKKRNVLCEVIPVHQLFTATWRYVNRREKYLCLHQLRHCQWCRSCLLRRLKQQKNRKFGWDNETSSSSATRSTAYRTLKLKNVDNSVLYKKENRYRTRLLACTILWEGTFCDR